MNKKCLLRRWPAAIALAFSVSLIPPQLLNAQVSQERMAAIKENISSFKAHSDRLDMDMRKSLSGAPRHMIHLAEHWDRIEPLLRHLRQDDEIQQKTAAGEDSPEAEAALIGASTIINKPVSNTTKDLADSKLAGFTQAGTSVAWCGKNVVVGYFDSGSFIETLKLPRGLSFNGVARSTDAGQTYTDLGFLNPGPDLKDTLLGNPVVACTDAATFFFASLMEDRHVGSDTNDDTSDIAVSRSTDGGKTWGSPVSRVSKNAGTHTLNHPWMAVDPGHPERIYLTYTDWDKESVDEAKGRCPQYQTGSAVEMICSMDGGKTWSTTPVVISLVCLSNGTDSVLGSRVAVGPAGEVHVAWRASSPEEGIYESHSTDAGKTFSAPVKVNAVTRVGYLGQLQGLFGANELPSLAVDPRAGSQNVYLAWNDGRNASVTDIYGSYRCADILFSRSEDGGATWLGTPVKVNLNVEPLTSGGCVDQFFPAIAVDKNGNIGACFYDRRADDNNFLIQRYCAYSTDKGNTWTELKITNYQFPPLHGQDLLVDITYMGDYDALATDFLKTQSGFIGTYTDNKAASNPNVMATKFSF